MTSLLDHSLSPGGPMNHFAILQYCLDSLRRITRLSSNHPPGSGLIFTAVAEDQPSSRSPRLGLVCLPKTRPDQTKPTHLSPVFTNSPFLQRSSPHTTHLSPQQVFFHDITIHPHIHDSVSQASMLTRQFAVITEFR
ncbi:hypothetical protein VTN96DRAFT_9351 [Rasamsonia emersonii]